MSPGRPRRSRQPREPRSMLGAVEQELHEAHAELLSSMARDRLAGRPLELDAIGGAVLRAGARHGVETPTVAAARRRHPQRATLTPWPTRRRSPRTSRAFQCDQRARPREPDPQRLRDRARALRHGAARLRRGRGDPPRHHDPRRQRRDRQLPRALQRRARRGAQRPRRPRSSRRSRPSRSPAGPWVGEDR